MQIMSQGEGSEMPSGQESADSLDVFLSYASHDAAAASTVCEGLERTGITCWIAPRDVTPGAQYADAIVRAINRAKVLVVVLSESAVASTHVGKEIERASAKRRPIIALRTNEAPLTPALEYFLSESQWIDAPGGAVAAALPKLTDAVRRLLASASSAPKADGGTAAPFAPARTAAKDTSRFTPRILIAVAGVIVVTLLSIIGGRAWLAHRVPDAPAVQAAPAAATFSPPAHSVAVMPFVNMSGDREQDYFSDGLSEELLNSLVTIPDLQVAARTSSFSFKGSTADTAEIARKLNVGAILEGSVRKDGAHVRITAQLINAVTGFHLWSKTYDRDLKDVLKLQTEVATEVTSALQATLMADAAAHVDLGGTSNPQAFDAFLRGEKARRSPPAKERDLAQIAAYDEALRLDPQFAKAYVGKAGALADLANYLPPQEGHDTIDQALKAVTKAVELAPGLGRAHAAYATGLSLRFEFAAAAVEFDRALALAPGDADVLRKSAVFLSSIGRSDAALERARRALTLDPLNSETHRALGDVLSDARRYPEAVAAFDQAISLNPANTSLTVLRGFARFGMGQFDAARLDCENPPIDWASRTCLAMVYDKLHRPSDAKTALDALTAATGDTAAYQYTQIYTQWGNLPKALDWLDTAYRIQDPGMQGLKMDALLDPLRGEPRYREMLQNLKFPQ
jgi:serine/threonine-protein kinase